MYAKSYDPAFLYILIATIALSFKGILVKFVFAADTSVDFLMLIRFAVAVPIFWLGVRIVHGAIGRLDAKQWSHCVGSGTLFCLATYFDFTALLHIEVGVSRLVVFTFPLFVMLITSLIELRAPTKKHFLAFVMSYSGLLLVVGFGEEVDPFSEKAKGIMWALAASVTYALYLLHSQTILKQISSSRFTAASNTITLILVFLFLLCSERIKTIDYTLEGAIWSVLIATFCTIIPFFLLYEGIKRCGAHYASLVSLSGPALTLIFSFVLLGEELNITQIIGVIISIIGISTLEAKWFLKLLNWQRKTLRSVYKSTDQ